MISTENDEEKKLLPHHEQLPLCTSRLPYRQGRKLTAVKVYTINDESNHLLIFGVPSLNLRREAKALFLPFGNLLQFNISKNHPAEQFTETYHVKYEKIQSARIAKRMVDTKNFYGGSLHVCYAPEFESVQETKTKLLQRKKSVLLRLKNLQKETTDIKTKQNDAVSNMDLQLNSVTDTHQHDVAPIVNELDFGSMDNPNHNEDKVSKKINMGDRNIIYLNPNKRKMGKEVVIEKKFKPCYAENDKIENIVEIVDCTSADRQVISNINEGLNYNKFGNEIIKKVEAKPLNRIVFKCSKKS